MVETKTIELEHAIYQKLKKMGTYLAFEVAMPNIDTATGKRIFSTTERVDLLSVDSKDIWRFYELKVTKADFHSRARKTFLGNYNYYVMPAELFDQVRDEIVTQEPDVGCYITEATGKGHYSTRCVIPASKLELRVDHTELMLNFMHAAERDAGKFRGNSFEQYLNGDKAEIAELKKKLKGTENELVLYKGQYQQSCKEIDAADVALRMGFKTAPCHLCELRNTEKCHPEEHGSTYSCFSLDFGWRAKSRGKSI